MTLIETLVVIGVLGLLVALTLPAVQRVRESARRAWCAANLRQVGLALHAYEAQHHVFPSPCGDTSVYRKSDGRLHGDIKQFSIFTYLLPSLDQMNLYNAVNFDVSALDPYLSKSMSTNARGVVANTTAMSATLTVLLCPSDAGEGDAGWTGGVNYRANLGSEQSRISLTGPFMNRGVHLSSASVLDGTSHTTGFSEKLRGRVGATRFNPSTDMAYAIVGPPRSFEESLRACRTLRSTTDGYFSATGLTWFASPYTQTTYNHSLEPNSRTVDCAWYNSTLVSGFVGARSRHPGGVDVLMMDGSARFVSRSIQLDVWRALGTRAGGETVAEE